MSLVQLEQLSKTYRDGTRALIDVDLTVEAGEIITLVGPSGCGKSTLLRLIAGLDMPTTGHVWYNGRDITRMPAEQRGMGVVFQNYALFPHMSVADNIGFGLRVRGVKPAERRRRVTRILNQLRLDDLAHRRPDQLSGGQQQRVALGRALAIEPALLLLDEPLTALDARLRETLRHELRRTLEQFGITSIYVTHDQAEALSLGDRVVVLNNGRVEQVGTPRTIYQRPASAFVAQFIGTTNRLPGTIRRTPAGLQAETPIARLPLLTIGEDGGAHGHNGGTPPDAHLPEGTPIEVLIRPEDLALCAPNQAHFAGNVAQVQFLGDRLRLFVDVEGSAQELVADVEPHTQVCTGSTVALRVNRATPLHEGI